ncbi:TPA: hypothetical protein N0F65_001216 [Lagenidium giganteum]|uniref:NADP-dependent oxidoreductase domain-containing protein n=1 Tax=Lagenidium giganteum TaxID=4803 RepID=A0AAV2Z4X8_9STRA|nr:TPA: hypothetical protein N0F65_001216 [Lagenidium giganteum]
MGMTPKGLEDKIAKTMQLTQVADDIGCSMAQLAIAWCASNPQKALDFVDKITPDVKARIDEIVPFTPVLDTPPHEFVVATRTRYLRVNLPAARLMGQW